MFFHKIFKAHCAQILSHFGPKVDVWLIIWPIFPSFQLIALVFFTVFRIPLGLPHPSIICIFQCVCTHPINLMGIQLLCCVHDNERIKTYDVVCNTFFAITWDVGFHVGREQLHVLPSNTFNSFCWWVDIVFTKDDICILINVVITNPTKARLLPRSCATQGFVLLVWFNPNNEAIVINTSLINSSP
jgi:hypothetical protein